MDMDFGLDMRWDADKGVCSVFESELQDVIPIIHATIAGTRIIGRMTAGYVFFPRENGELEGMDADIGFRRNRKGLLVPTSTTDQELQHLRNSLPDEVKIQVCRRSYYNT